VLAALVTISQQQIGIQCVRDLHDLKSGSRRMWTWIRYIVIYGWFLIQHKLQKFWTRMASTAWLTKVCRCRGLDRSLQEKLRSVHLSAVLARQLLGKL
jgi:hypothetical protein